MLGYAIRILFNNISGKFYQAFNLSFESLWMMWETMVMGEPIYILADTPNSSSQIVQALVELIKPVYSY